ncbi:MAG: hypothetical protein DYH20_04845 [Gammaproteobacteria bacterium PRO9]|nr:hypothetical protein [Gammaproteobacteria bacterium PRO9]
MQDTRRRSSSRSQLKKPLLMLLWLVALALAGVVAVPVAGYVVGKRVIGAYEGRLGLTDYLGSIYTAAGHGELLAWLLILSPLLVVIAWSLVFRLGRRL